MKIQEYLAELQPKCQVVVAVEAEALVVDLVVPALRCESLPFAASLAAACESCLHELAAAFDARILILAPVSPPKWMRKVYSSAELPLKAESQNIVAALVHFSVLAWVVEGQKESVTKLVSGPVVLKMLLFESQHHAEFFLCHLQAL